MIVNSFNQEFGYELLSSVPLAYDSFLKGKLKETVSAIGSEPLYYFSPKHTINQKPRSWHNTEIARNNKLENTVIHTFERPKLSFPPYKEHYKNTEFKWDKPTLCICNRYNKEWNQDPINYFSPELLEWMFSNLKDKYEIVYFAVDLPEELQDHTHSMELNDIEICKKHNIKVFQEINKRKWNETLLKIFANCDHYITMNGGYAIMASLFTGTNIIYSKRGPRHAKELDVNSFYRWYPNHNNQRTLAVETYKKLKEKIQAIYIDELPTANIILRTSNRPYAFQEALYSIVNQTYPNINLVITTDDLEGCVYSRQAKARHIEMDRVSIKETPESEVYGKPFPSNEYINRVQKLVKGFILILDDDDSYTSVDSVKIIMENAERDKLLIWKTEFSEGKIIPSVSFGKMIKLFDVTAIGMCYHTNHIDKTDWSQWKRADFRTAKKLSLTLNVKWINFVLTKIQGSPGQGKRKDIKNIFFKTRYSMKTIKLLDTGKIVRVPRGVADECVANGEAIYLKEVLDILNTPIIPPRTKPIVEENKELKVVREDKIVPTMKTIEKVKKEAKPKKDAAKKPSVKRSN